MEPDGCSGYFMVARPPDISRTMLFIDRFCAKNPGNHPICYLHFERGNE